MIRGGSKGLRAHFTSRYLPPLTTISTCRLPQREQTGRELQSSRGCRPVSLGRLGGIGLDLMLAFSAPNDQPDAGGGSVAERHQWTGLGFHG